MGNSKNSRVTLDTFNSLLYAVIFGLRSVTVGEVPNGSVTLSRLGEILSERGINRSVVHTLVEFLVRASILTRQDDCIGFGEQARFPDAENSDLIDPQWAVQQGMLALQRMPRRESLRLLERLGDEFGDTDVSLWTPQLHGVTRIELHVKQSGSGVEGVVGSVSPVPSRSKNDPSVSLYLDPGDAPTETIVELFAAVSALHEAYGGTPLVFVQDGGGVISSRSAVR